MVLSNYLGGCASGGATAAGLDTCNAAPLGHANILGTFRKEDAMLKRVAILALLGVSLASAKTYTFTVSDPTQAGSAQLKAGEYRLKVDGSQVVLMDNTGHQIDVIAKVEAADQKFDQTSVSTSKADGTNRIQSIQLGGSNNRVVFQ